MFDNIEIRQHEIEGETNWYWIKDDKNCFESVIQHWETHHVHSYFKHIKNKMHWPGIEPGPPAWQASILPLNHQCLV